MSTTIDQRVIQVRFDNALFERKVAETIASISKLDDKLKLSEGTKGLAGVEKAANKVDFTGISNGIEGVSKKFLGMIPSISKLDDKLKLSEGTKGLAGVEKAANKVDFTGISNGIEGVSKKFLAMSTVAITALAGVTSQALKTGTQMTKALTVAPKMDGFKEYEMNMNSIQTILANTDSKGTTLEDVNGALDELNKYSDRTIYNFAQMTKNIGTFTAAGVDLDTSVAGIKGIANLAAISGADSNKASMAMYQLSQAMASGQVRLQDWVSVVNADMGGEVFQKALFDTGQAMKTIESTHPGQTFEEWQKAGNTFRESLADEWLTSDVLVTTLNAFAGDMTEAQLASVGYTDEQVKSMARLGELGIKSAQDVKTLTQLWGTLQEAIGTGWADTYRIVIGDFEEAKSLLTAISESFGGMISNAAASRNKILDVWKAFGGRNKAIEAMHNMFTGLTSVLKPIKEAFEDIFPPKTAEDLINFTYAVAEFSKKLKLSEEQAAKVKSIFSGVFSLFSIGLEVVKQLAKFVWNLGGIIKGSGGETSDFAAKWGDMATVLEYVLVKSGGIADFFESLTKNIRKVVTGFKDFFKNVKIGIDSTGAFDGTVENAGNALEKFWNQIKKVGDFFSVILAGGKDLGKGLGEMTKVIMNWVSDLWKNLTENVNADDESLFNLLNLGILSAIGIGIKKLIDLISDFDATGGIIATAKDMFGELGSTLKAFQTDLKAGALMKIAIAVAVLTASIVVLSFLDPEDIAKALATVAAGFVGLLRTIGTLTAAKAVWKLGSVATSMIKLAIALSVLSIAIVRMGRMDNDELARGLIGVAGGMAILVAGTKAMAVGGAGTIRGAFALVIMAGSLTVLALAVKMFAGMEWDELGRGLAGVAGSLAVLTLGLKGISMVKGGMIRASISLGILGAGLLVMSLAVKEFAKIDMRDLGQGLLAIAATLAVITAGMNFMPATLPLTAAGLVLVAIALRIMSDAVASFGGMSFDELVQGIGAVAILLGILAVGVNAMSSAIVGAAAMLIVAHSLTVMAVTITALSQLSIKEIAIGLGAVVLVFLVLAGVANLLVEAVPGMLAFGAGLAAIGAGIAIIGAGLFLTAMAFEIFAKLGKDAGEGILTVLLSIARAIPYFIAGVVVGLLEGIGAILTALPMLIEALVNALGSLIVGLTRLIPPLVDFVGELMWGLIFLIGTFVPPLITLGMQLLLALLHGIDENIEEITDTVSSIIVKFLDALTDNMPDILAAGTRLIVSFLEGIAENSDDIVEAATTMVVSILSALTDNAERIQEAVSKFMMEIIAQIGTFARRMVDAGTRAFVEFLNGLEGNIDQILESIGHLSGMIIFGLGGLVSDIADQGTEAFVQFLDSLGGNIEDVLIAISDLTGLITSSMATLITDIGDQGTAAFLEFLAGLGGNIEDITEAAGDLVTDIMTAISNEANNISDTGTDLLVDFLDGITNNLGDVCRAAGRVVGRFIRCITGEGRDTLLSGAGGGLVSILLGGVTTSLPGVGIAGGGLLGVFLGGAKGKKEDKANAANIMVGGLNGAINSAGEIYGPALEANGAGIANKVVAGMARKMEKAKLLVSTQAKTLGDAVASGISLALDVKSPSRVTMEIGRQVGAGLALGIAEDSSATTAANAMGGMITEALKSSLAKASSLTDQMEGFQPTVAPVLDLSEVERGAGAIDGLLGDHTMAPDASFDRALLISTMDQDRKGNGSEDDRPPAGDINFVQNNHSPKALGARDIYRNTKGQIARARDELENA